MTRLLVAGTGLIGSRHLGHIQDHPELQLAGVIEPDTKRHPQRVPCWTDITEVDKEADGIVIATPTPTHAPLTLAALRRGWHVLVEKPVAETLAEADTMIDAAAQAKRHILVGHHRRHHPRTAKLAEILRSGRLGQPIVASLLWCMRKPDDYFAPAWRQGMNGAPVKQNLIHDIDTLRMLFGDITAVTGTGSNAERGAPRTESGGAVLTFDNGVIATIAFSDTTPTPWGWEAGTGESPGIPHTAQDSLRIACTGGSIEFPSLRIWSGADHWGEAPTPTDTAVEDVPPWVRQLEHFAEVIAGRATPLVTAEDGRAALDAILQLEAATLPKGVTP